MVLSFFFKQRTLFRSAAELVVTPWLMMDETCLCCSMFCPSTLFGVSRSTLSFFVLCISPVDSFLVLRSCVFVWLEMKERTSFLLFSFSFFLALFFFS